MSIENNLDILCRWGRPHLFQLNDGDWLCRLDMFTPFPGMKLEVKSTADCKTALQATEECVEALKRLLAMQAASETAPRSEPVARPILGTSD